MSTRLSSSRSTDKSTDRSTNRFTVSYARVEPRAPIIETVLEVLRDNEDNEGSLVLGESEKTLVPEVQISLKEKGYDVQKTTIDSEIRKEVDSGGKLVCLVSRDGFSAASISTDMAIREGFIAEADFYLQLDEIFYRPGKTLAIDFLVKVLTPFDGSLRDGLKALLKLRLMAEVGYLRVNPDLTVELTPGVIYKGTKVERGTVERGTVDRTTRRQDNERSRSTRAKPSTDIGRYTAAAPSQASSYVSSVNNSFTPSSSQRTMRRTKEDEGWKLPLFKSQSYSDYIENEIIKLQDAQPGLSQRAAYELAKVNWRTAPENFNNWSPERQAAASQAAIDWM